MPDKLLPPALDFCSALDLKRVHSCNPVERILLFGGKRSKYGGRCRSCREDFISAISRMNHKIHPHVLLAESIYDLYKKADYSDLLTFELDLAELSTATVIIPEGWGSVAELGSFSVLKPFRKQLLVVNRKAFQGRTSFINHGPIKYIQNRNKDAICYYHWKVKQNGEYKPSSFKHHRDLADKISKVSLANSQGKRIDHEWPGHVFFFLLGFLKVSLLATLTELEHFCNKLKFDFKRKQIEEKIKLLEHLGYVKTFVYQGQSYIAINDRNPSYVKFGFKKGSALTREIQWVEFFLEYYKKFKPQRIKAWQKYLIESSGELRYE